ncbi:MAG TPA: trp operon repressor [Treponema sp.]|nr:trp operon repressor [Treponema sp.]
MATQESESQTSALGKQYEQSFSELCALLTQIDDESFMADFMGCLFTVSERRDFAKRWSLVKELYAGTTQREIAKKYNMSLCNITRGSRELKKEDSAFRRILDGTYPSKK